MERRILTLICCEADSRLPLGASVIVHSFSMSTAAVINLPMWNPTFMKSRFLVRLSVTHYARWRGTSYGI
jgi:hypothetical protein